jgi:hypothetical protein
MALYRQQIAAVTVGNIAENELATTLQDKNKGDS